MDLTIRTATFTELETVLDWAAAEGWNPGRADAEAFYATDPAGHVVGEYDGRLVSAISAVRYGTNFGFIGLYIVRPEFRGRGFGYATWQQALAPLAGRNLGLDGVVAQQAAYARSGFAIAHRNVRYRTDNCAPLPGDGLPAIPASAHAAVRAFDRRFFPTERPAFLDRWLTQPGVETCHAERHGALTAYGVMRPCRAGWKIGPLFATNPADASRALVTLLGRAAGQPVFLDVPADHPAAVALAQRCGMTPVFETARMYTRGRPQDIDWRGVFGITTFELG